MDESNSHLFRSDAWLFLAISVATGSHPRASLGSVITIADGIQHAIPTKDETDGAFRRLQGMGFIRWNGEVVELLKPGKEFLTRATQGTRYRLEAQDAIEAALHAAPWSEDYHPTATRAGESEQVSSAQWNEAMKAYGS